MGEPEGRIRLNPDIEKVVCSITGKPEDVHDYRRPLGLCSCCPAPGKPLVVVYDLSSIRKRLDAHGWGKGPGIWHYGAHA